MGILFESGGMLTTVQDSGRFGYQQYGVSVAGVSDWRSFAIANHLVGNVENEAVLEVNLLGPAITFEESAVIAITGGNLSPMIDGKAASMYRALPVKKGAQLTFGATKTGCRSFIAFAGGLDIEPVMGSRSTFVKASLGGFQGRKLEKGDRIGFRDPSALVTGVERRFVEPDDFSGDEFSVRVIMGPQDDAFTPAGIDTFLGSLYTVTSEFDRMGSRLEGDIIEFKDTGDIISDGMAFGALQVASHGNPILTMADRQTTGGYAKIATVISADFPKIAQLTPGKKTRFVAIDIAEAQELYIAGLAELRTMRQKLDESVPAPQASMLPEKQFRVVVNGKSYDVSIQEVE